MVEESSKSVSNGKNRVSLRNEPQEIVSKGEMLGSWPKNRAIYLTQYLFIQNSIPTNSLA